MRHKPPHKPQHKAPRAKNRKVDSGLVGMLTPILMRHRAEKAASGLPAMMSAAERAVSTLYSGDHRQRKAGSGEKFWQFRDYDSGTDRPQDIDWRQSAKGERLYVRQKEWQTAQTILFWVQDDRGMTMNSHNALSTKHEAAVILSLGLAILLTRAGERIGPVSEPGRAGRGELALQNLGDVLSRSPDPRPVTPQLPVTETLPRQSSVILCGDFLQPPEELDRALGPLSAQAPHGMLVQILDPAEADLHYNGRVIFRPFDDSRDFSIANVPSIRDAYLARLQAHIDNVRAVALRHGYAHVLHITRDDPRLALSTAWQIMSPEMQNCTGGNP